MSKLVLLVLIFMFIHVRSQQSDTILICKSVSSLFDFVLEDDLDNLPSEIPQDNPPTGFQRLKQDLKTIKGLWCF